MLLKIKTNDTPNWNGMFLISLCEGINVQSILLCLPQNLEQQFTIKNQTIVFAIIPILLFYLFNYYMYVKNLTQNY